MTWLRSITAAAFAAMLALPAVARDRSAAERLAFIKEHPCPSTGQRHGSCPGYVVDHIRPLCAGGPDHRSNMQWQAKAESLRKDAQERRECRRLRRDAR